MQKNLWFAILVSALGYFVDVYDIILFSVVRVPSLQSLGVSPEKLVSTGLVLMNLQLLGMLLGGLLWGILGDKRGRFSILFGSIILYSTANLLNAFVHNVETYAVLRFIAGIGLAGELGAGVTLVSELMTKETRGYGTMLIAATGIFGGIAGGLVGDMMSWRTAYLIGGLMGFVLLLLRIGVQESGLFKALHAKPISRGNLLHFFRTPRLLSTYIRCLLMGLPLWIFIGLIMTLSPEIAQALNIQGPISAGYCLMFFNIGVGMGDICSSVLCQIVGSRKISGIVFLSLSLIFSFCFFLQNGTSTFTYYFFCSLLGFSSGYWAIFLMIASEQFGTNLRATATTSLPNLVRGAIVPISAFLTLIKPQFGIVPSISAITLTVLLISLLAVISLPETFTRNLDFVED